MAKPGTSSELVLGILPLDVSSSYQALLLTKIALVTVMLALALMNRYVLMPRLHKSTDSLQKLRVTQGTSSETLARAIGER